MQVWGELDQGDSQALVSALSVARERTVHQDAAFGFRQLVDIAERALSPGINDPTTAVQVLDQLHDLLRRLAPRVIPGEQRVDDAGRLRLVVGPQNSIALLGMAFCGPTGRPFSHRAPCR